VRGDPVDLRTDIFSLGAILYEMVTGRHPFDARNSLSRMSAILEAEPPPLSSRLGSIPPELNVIVRRALAKDPQDRYGNMQELLADLKTVRSCGTPHVTHSEESLKSHRLCIAGWLAVGLLLLALIVSLLLKLIR